MGILNFSSEKSNSNNLIEMTKDDLKCFDGIHNTNIYISIKGEIFDVTNSDFYKPGGPYHVFAGRDASVGLAKMSHDVEFLDTDRYDWNNCLDEKERKILDDWYDKYTQKYKKIAKLVN